MMLTLDDLSALAGIAAGEVTWPGQNPRARALERQGLLAYNAEQGAWVVTERAQVFIKHLLAQPLPEPVTSWQIPATQSGTWGSQPRFVPLGGIDPASLKPGAVVFIDDGTPPPKPPPPKPIPNVVPADDAQERKRQAAALIDAGYGTSEIAQTLDMDQAIVEDVFHRGA